MGKNIKDAAVAGSSVFDQIMNGNVKDVQNTKDTKEVKATKTAKAVKNRKPAIEWERLNLKIPREIKEYLNVAAARVSIAQRRNVSLTEYFCDLVRADMKKHEGK